MLVRPVVVVVALLGLLSPSLSSASDSMPPELAAALRRARAEEHHRLVPDGDAWSAATSSSSSRARFSTAGIEITGKSSKEVAWSFRLSLTAWGRGATTIEVPPGAATVDGTRFEIRRAALTEWYVNDERGCEQGFTLDAPPPVGAIPGDVRLVLAVAPEFSVEVFETGRGARFTATTTGAHVLYDGLRAWDARGRELDARLEAEAGTLALLVDDTDAAYPVTIDPWIWSLDAIFRADPREWSYEFFGDQVAVAGDTALVRASRDHTTGSDSGTVYVFTRSGSAWDLNAKLTSEAGVDESFGVSLAIEGDTMLVGARGSSATLDPGATYVYVRAGTGWSRQATLIGFDAEYGDSFGGAVAVDGDTVLVGASGDDDAGEGSGAVHVFTRTGTSWEQQAKLLADDGAEGDQFGMAVALDGDTALIGAPGDDVWAENWGSAYVFTRTGSTWTQQAHGAPVNGSRDSGFGSHVALDADTALIGAPSDYQPNESFGAAYVFVRRGTTWSEEAKLTMGGGPDTRMGWSVALVGDAALVGGSGNRARGEVYVFNRTGTAWNRDATLTGVGDRGEEFGRSLAFDGTTVIGGIPFMDFGRSTSAGAACVFSGGGGVWTRDAVLALGEAVDTSGDNFGASVALADDVALVGAYGHDGLGINAGAVYVFAHDGTGWERRETWFASDGEAGDGFGVDVALDGNFAVVGARGDDDRGANAGAAYVFARSGTAWSQEVKLSAPDGEAGDKFGFRVAVDEDLALIGAHGEDECGADAGSAYLFRRSGTSWSPLSKLTAPDARAGQRFGISVDLDGEFALIGADQIGGGQAYVFRDSGTSWESQAKLTASDRELDDRFGIDVAIDGATAVVGAFGDDDLGSSAGAAYVFERRGTSWIETAKLVADDGRSGHEFGNRLALDEGTLLVGAPGFGSARGAAYTFRRFGAVWTPQAKLYLGWSANAFDRMGAGLALDGTTALLGAPGHDDFFAWDDSGAAYLFTGFPEAHALFRNAGTNPESYSALTPPVLGQTFEATIDLGGTTGHTTALLAGYSAPLTVVLGAGQTGLVDFTGPELFGFPAAAGPVAVISLSIPSDLSLLGLEIASQAAHVGGVTPFALSNARDLLIGY